MIRFVLISTLSTKKLEELEFTQCVCSDVIFLNRIPLPLSRPTPEE